MPRIEKKPSGRAFIENIGCDPICKFKLLITTKIQNFDQTVIVVVLQLKGCPSDLLSKEIEYYIRAAGLVEKRNKLTKTLSGGQKRKLSVCLALIARSKVCGNAHIS